MKSNEKEPFLRNDRPTRLPLSTRELLGNYWYNYGGFAALRKSPYLWTALLLTLLMCHTWTHEAWWEDVVMIIPSILGFSLGGYAILLSFGSEEFKEVIAGASPDDIDGASAIPGASPFMEVNATFVHFLLLQSLSLLFALVAKSFDYVLAQDSIVATLLAQAHIDPRELIQSTSYVAGFIGYFSFVYAVCLAIAATLGIYRVATWYDAYQTTKNSLDDEKPDS